MRDLIDQVKEGFRQQQDRQRENLVREFGLQIAEREARYQLQQTQRDKEIAEEKERLAERSRTLDRETERFINEKSEVERLLREKETGYKRRLDELTKELEQEKRGRSFDTYQTEQRENNQESEINQMKELHIKEKEELIGRINQLDQQLARLSLQKEQTDRVN